MTKNYYRRITEALPQDLKKALKIKNLQKHSKRYLLVFLASSFFILSLYAVFSYMEYASLKEQWLRTFDSLSYWEEIATKQGNSPDAYYQAGFYAAQLRDNKKAIIYLEKALMLDPGFERAQKLAQQLTKTTN